MQKKKKKKKKEKQQQQVKLGLKTLQLAVYKNINCDALILIAQYTSMHK